MKIKTKLWFSTTTLVLIVILIVWVFQIFLLDKFYIVERSNLLVSQGERIASMIDIKDHQMNITNELLEYINNFDISMKIKVDIVDYEDNKIFMSSPAKHDFVRGKSVEFENLQEMFLKDPEIRKYIKDGTRFVKVKHYYKLNKDYITALVPVRCGKENIGSVLLTSSVESIKETITILKKQLSIITIILLIIGTMLSFILSKIFTKPILKMIDASKEIAKGNFDINLKVESDDEIASLGESMNEMCLKLSQTEMFRKEFIANVSHEFKTPISLIRAYSELITDTYDDCEKNEYANVIIDESNRLNTMVEDMLYLSEIESGHCKLKKEVINLRSLLNNVVEKLIFFSSNKNIDIKVDINFDIDIIADKSKIYQVFYNIINNAITYSNENKNVLINSREDDACFIIDIIDEGVGISDEDLPYIWDRFYKVNKSRKRDSSGTGLGMSIVKNILDMHGFECIVRSEINKGTCISIKIPV